MFYVNDFPLDTQGDDLAEAEKTGINVSAILQTALKRELQIADR
jgi:post-segregation antitoxin (ccd killing protein)